MVKEKYADHIRERVIDVANYVFETKSDIRSTAKKFLVSKSTVHVDLSKRLKEIDPLFYSTIHEILVANKYEGQMKGGEATKEHYRHILKQ